MKDNKKVYKFLGKPGADFFLWPARTEAALAAKEVLAMINEDYLSRGEAPSVELQKKIATARASLIQGLGDKPLRFCLCVEDNPFEIWRRLKDRYAVSNTATNVQLQKRLAGMSYEGQSMQDYIDSFERIFNRLAAMKGEVAEDLQVAMLLASFGDKSKSRFGYSIAALQTSQDNLDRETVTSTLLHENDDHFLRPGSAGGAAKIDEHTRALSANESHQYGGSWLRTWKGKTKARSDRRRCYAYGEIGHIARDCTSKDGNTRMNSFIGSNEEGAHANVGQVQPARLLMAHVQKSNLVLGSTTKPCRSDDQCGSTDVGIQSSMLPQSVPAEKQRSCALNAMKSSYRHQRHHNVFFLDSRSSEHMIWSNKHLGNLKSIKAQDICLGDGNRVTARHAGSLFLETLVRISGKQFERSVVLQNVLYVPDLHSNLISCSRLCVTELCINIERDRCQGSHNDTIQFQGRNEEGVYQIIARCLDPRLLHASTATSKQREEPRCSSSSAVDIRKYSESFRKLWHERLGHAHFGRIKQLKSRCAVTGMDSKGAFDSREQCDSCMKGKQTKRTLGIKKTRSIERCVVIHTDICRPMSGYSFSGSRYFVSFVDEYTGCIVIVPIARKSGTLKQFKLFQAWIERKFGGVVKQVRSDHGGEYIAMKDYLSSAGIEHYMSPSYCPNLNGMAERANRTIVDCARTMLEHALLPQKFWAEAVVHAARIRNLLFCPRDRTTSSHELISGLKPDISYLRTFGSLAWYHIPKEARKKLDAKSEKGILICCQKDKQYKIWLVDRSVAVVSRDVTVCETRFPGCDLNEERDKPEYELVEDSDKQQSGNFPTTREDRYSKSNSAPVQRENLESHENDNEVPITSAQQQRLTYYPRCEEESNTEPCEEADRSTADHSRGQRITENTECMEESHYPRREHRRPSYYTPVFGNVARALAMLERNPNPTTVKEALTQDDAAEWHIAIDSELNSLRQHGTWDIVDHPKGVKPLSRRFVFIRKLDENGIVIRHKARLVVRGYLQGDVEQTIAPVVDFTTVRTCLAVAVQRNYSIQQLDVSTAFLHGEIDSQVLVNPPSGVDICESGKTFKLRRGLYGLKQAPRLWQDN